MNTKYTFRFLTTLVLMVAGLTAKAQQATYSVQEITSTLPSRVWINITGPTGGTSQAAIAYLPQGTFGLDFGYDAMRFMENNTIAVYTIAQETPLVIQARPLFSSRDIVQMGYIAPTAGNYTLSLDHKDGVFNNGQHIFIKDNETGTVTDLNEGALFFTSEAGTFDERFQVVYTDAVMGTAQPSLNADSVIVSKSAQTINITAGTTLINNVNIYDINGRQLYSQNGLNTTQTSISSLNASKQILIVEVSTAKGKASKRIVY
jgi:trimeric autotransporter adhesin